MTITKNMSPICLYGMTPYDRSGKVRWLLMELGIHFENRWINRENKEYESPEFLKKNPLGRIPVLEIGDKVIFESGAICSYLTDLYLEKGLAPAITSPDRGDYQKWMYFAASTLDPIQGKIMIIEDIPPGPIQAEKEKTLQTDLRDALKALDQVLKKILFLCQIDLAQQIFV